MGWFKHQLDLSFLASWNALASVFLRKLSGTPCISPRSGQALCLCFSMERFRLGMDGSQVTVDCDPDPRYIRIGFQSESLPRVFKDFLFKRNFLFFNDTPGFHNFITIYTICFETRFSTLKLCADFWMSRGGHVLIPPGEVVGRCAEAIDPIEA